jgi:crossover junction endodeoxyribonuclease RuvC
LSYVGFDFGQNCGYAVLDKQGSRITSSTWELGKISGKTLARFEQLLTELLLEHGACRVGYEKVYRHRGTTAAHAYGAYEGFLWRVCYEIGIPKKDICLVTVSEIKQTATGLADADKDAVGGFAIKRWKVVPDDDNESDALWCAEVIRRKSLGEPLFPSL